MFEAEVGDTTTVPTAKRMTDGITPLLTSMQLFGLYFRCGKDADRKVDEKSRRRWNAFTIYALVVVILIWLNVARMFSVFKNTFV